MHFKRVHMCVSCYLHNQILRPSFLVIRGPVGPVRLEISTHTEANALSPRSVF